MTSDLRQLKDIHPKPTGEKSALLIRLFFRSSELPISNLVLRKLRGNLIEPYLM